MTLNKFLQQTVAAETPTGLWQASLDYFNNLGFQRVSYHHYKPDLSGSSMVEIRVDGFPQDWVKEYIEEKLYLVDPIPEIAANTADPFLWSRARNMRRLGAQQTAFLNRLAKAGLGDGLAVQVFGPGMRNGYIGLGFGPRDTPQISPAALRQTQYAAQISHLAYCRMTDDLDPQHRDLSPREREVLAWIARGKSNSVIGEILGLSRHTVDTLVRRLFDKLDVGDRTSAAIKALGSGLILPVRE